MKQIAVNSSVYHVHVLCLPAFFLQSPMIMKLLVFRPVNCDSCFEISAKKGTDPAENS